MILGPAERIKAYHSWMTQVLKFNLDHLSMLYESENFEIALDTCISTILGTNEKIQKNLGYLGHIGQIMTFINTLNDALTD